MFVVNIWVIFVFIGASYLSVARCDEWQDRVAKLEELVETLNERITEQDRDILEIKQNVSCSCDKGDKERRLLEGIGYPTTAFYAYMNQNEKNPTPSRTLVFDVVRVNVNNAYSGNSGTFRAPVAGTYVFTFSLRVYGGGSGSYEVVRNGNAEGAAIAIIPHGTSDDQEQVTGTVVIDAAQGDEVYVRTHPSLGHAGDLLSNLHGRSMFAGWMISH